MKVNIKIFLIFFFIISSSFFLTSDDLKNWKREKDKAEILYNSGKYEEAIIIFREIILNSNNENFKNESYFWLAKAYIDTEKLKSAEENLEYYLANCKATGLNYPEAVYQKGRLLFLQEQYQSGIEQLQLFIKSYPLNKLVSNAYYWIGECLYAVGQFDDSEVMFNIILSKYKSSIKFEASKYKLKLIEHKKNEIALQNLLKWSQEQYLTALSQFRIKEKTLQEALEEYKKGGVKLSDTELERYKKLEEENTQLKGKIKTLENQIANMQKIIDDKGLNDKLKQLELKEQLLNQKEETLKLLEDELRKKEKSLEK